MVKMDTVHGKNVHGKNDCYQWQSFLDMKLIPKFTLSSQSNLMDCVAPLQISRLVWSHTAYMGGVIQYVREILEFLLISVMYFLGGVTEYSFYSCHRYVQLYLFGGLYGFFFFNE